MHGGTRRVLRTRVMTQQAYVVGASFMVYRQANPSGFSDSGTPYGVASHTRFTVHQGMRHIRGCGTRGSGRGSRRDGRCGRRCSCRTDSCRRRGRGRCRSGRGSRRDGCCRRRCDCRADSCRRRGRRLQSWGRRHYWRGCGGRSWSGSGCRLGARDDGHQHSDQSEDEQSPGHSEAHLSVSFHAETLSSGPLRISRDYHTLPSKSEETVKRPAIERPKTALLARHRGVHILDQSVPKILSRRQ